MRVGGCWGAWLLLGACAAEPCEEIDDHFGSCGLRATIEFCESKRTRCTAECYLETSCLEIVRRSTPLQACVSGCGETKACDDGDTLIEWFWICDGEVDCIDGSDEEDCP